MWVSKLQLENFRNFTALQVDLLPGTNIIHGDNANGKTNFIEAICFCATGKSIRANHDRELINFNAEESHLQAVVDLQDFEIGKTGKKLESTQKRRIDVHLFRDGKKKGFAIDHIPLKKLSELFGSLLVVVFTPENLQIVKGGPAERRAFMDLEICQLSGVYYHALRQYYQALRQRNNLLKSIAKSKDKKLRETLEIWDAPLCENGTVIMTHRAAFLEQLGELAMELHGTITGGKERLNMTYKPQIIGGIDEYHERLKRSTERDIILGSTSVGIQKDDILFKIDETDARTYASQGQQRTAALAVKLAEIALIKQRTRHKPILLLDDVISELDERRQNFLFRNIGGLQTVITCTGVEEVLRKVSGNIIRVVDGRFYGTTK
ncbi:MAG: DNA replication/repair protein RecF [Defluviitaleaceae bacterium]|nr:DNA replication/repair protein RecF [Defluviitaleaceae bacterium]